MVPIRRGFFLGLVAAFGVNAAACAADETTWPPLGVSLYGDASAPDISGLWLGTITFVPGGKFPPGRGPADGRPATLWAPWPLPYTPAYQKVYDERVEAAKKGRQLGDVSATCLPFGLPMMLVSKVYPDEIVQTPGQVPFFMNNTFPLVIWSDGRGHPKNLEPSYNGHSIGYWIGDTLFVDTVGIDGKTGLEVMRNPHSDKLRIRWTVRKVARDTLQLHVTLYDEDAFNEPVVTTNIWRRMTDPKWQILDDASCFENNENLPHTRESGPAGFKKY